MIKKYDLIYTEILDDVNNKTNNNWILIFTDLLSLLLCFFLVIYSQSSPKDEFVRKLSNSVRMQYHFMNKNDTETPFKSNISQIKLIENNEISYIEQVIKHKFMINPVLNSFEPVKKDESVSINFDITDLFDKFNNELSEDGKRILYNLYSILIHLNPKIELLFYNDNFAASYKIFTSISNHLSNLGFNSSIEIQTTNEKNKHNIEFLIREIKTNESK